MTQTVRHTDPIAFQALWQRNLRSGARDHSPVIHEKLVQAYSEPGRYYHTLEHIECCLGLFEDIKDIADNADALALSLWFHDAIYEPGADDNEQRSANWFMDETRGIFDDSFRNIVNAQIMATLHCCNEIKDHDTRLMIDIDLSSFGMPWPIFLRDSENVRKELPQLTDAEFYPKQCAFSQRLLEKSRFFQSDYFYEHYEAQVRKNLSNYYHHVEQKLAKA